MKIAIITKRFSNTWGGAEMVAFNLVKGLLALNHTVDIYTSHADSDLPGLNIYPVKLRKIFSFLNPLIFRNKILKMIRKEDYDIVYSFCHVYPVDIYRLSAGIHRYWIKIQSPSVIKRSIKYSTSLVHPVKVYLDNNIFKNTNCRRYITNSELLKKQIVDFYCINEDIVKVIYNGVDTERFNPDTGKYSEIMRSRYRLKKDDKIVLFSGNNFKRKGLKALLKSLGKIRNEKLKLVVIGRGKSAEYLRLAKKSGLKGDSVIFAGYTDSIEKFYGMSDIFVLPTMYEPFANVCLEAMACGLPVVTTRLNGASELIKEGENGYVLYKWDNTDELSSLIKSLLSDKAYIRMGENAYQTARSFTWERHIRETLEVFESL